MVCGEVLQLSFEFAGGPRIHDGAAFAVWAKIFGNPVIRKNAGAVVCIILITCSLVSLFFFAPLLPRCCPALSIIVDPHVIGDVLIFRVITDGYDALTLPRCVARACPDF